MIVELLWLAFWAWAFFKVRGALKRRSARKRHERQKRDRLRAWKSSRELERIWK